MKSYKYTSETNTVVHIIEADGVSRKSMLVVGRDNNIDADYQEFLDWVAEGNALLPADGV